MRVSRAVAIPPTLGAARRWRRHTLRAVEHAFGRGESLALGVEEELLLVDPGTLALDHRVSELLPTLDGAVKPDVYEAEVETASPVCRDARGGGGASSAPCASACARRARR